MNGWNFTEKIIANVSESRGYGVAIVKEEDNMLTDRLQEGELAREDHPAPRLLLQLLLHSILLIFFTAKHSCCDLELVGGSPVIFICFPGKTSNSQPVDKMEGQVDGCAGLGPKWSAWSKGQGAQRPAINLDSCCCCCC